MLRYRSGPESDPFYDIYSSKGWLTDYDPPRDFPFFVNIEPTNRCQMRCLFCSRQLSKRPKANMSLDLAREVFREVGAHKGASVRLTGWGEPLEHPRLAEIIELASKEGVRTKLYTNGQLLEPDLFKELRDAGVTEIQFSSQGLNARQYAFSRRGGSYELLAAAMRKAARTRGPSDAPFLSLLTSVLQNELEEEDPVRFSEEWLQNVDKVAIDLTNLNFVGTVPEVKPFLEMQSAGLARRPCVDVFLALEVKVDGSVQFCGQDSQATPEHTIGKLWESGLSLEKAWKSPQMEAKREQVGRRMGHYESPICRNCYHNTTKYDLFKKLQGSGEGSGEASGEGSGKGA